MFQRNPEKINVEKIFHFGTVRPDVTMLWIIPPRARLGIEDLETEHEEEVSFLKKRTQAEMSTLPGGGTDADRCTVEVRHFVFRQDKSSRLFSSCCFLGSG